MSDRRKLGLLKWVTGFPWIIWLLPGDPENDSPYAMRIDVSVEEAWSADRIRRFSIEPTILQTVGEDMDIQDLELLNQFILKNQSLIEDYWFGIETDPVKVRDRVIKIIRRAVGVY